MISKKITAYDREELIENLGLFAKKAKIKLQSKGVTEKDLQGK